MVHPVLDWKFKAKSKKVIKNVSFINPKNERGVLGFKGYSITNCNSLKVERTVRYGSGSGSDGKEAVVWSTLHIVVVHEQRQLQLGKIWEFSLGDPCNR